MAALEGALLDERSGCEVPITVTLRGQVFGAEGLL